MDATVKQLTDAERDWIRAQLAAAAQFTTDYGSARTAPGLPSLDHAWASWIDRQAVQPEDPNAVINAVGVAFGQSVIDALDTFAWVIAEDDTGTDLAVYGLPGSADVLLYPAAMVAKRYERRESLFLQALHDQIIDQVRGLPG